MVQGAYPDTSSLSDGELPLHPYPVDESGFRAFTKSPGKVQGDVSTTIISLQTNHWTGQRMAMMNIYDFIMSYNSMTAFPMTDYFHTNFYLTLGVGSYKQPYKGGTAQTRPAKDLPEAFKYPEGPAQTCSGHWAKHFGFIESRKPYREIILGKTVSAHGAGL